MASIKTIAIAGNPNCGKSTIFNALTGLRQKVGNYPGVTVEFKSGKFQGPHGETHTIIDLPGTYSLQSRSADEAVSRNILLGREANIPAPDLVLCILDASNLERNLYLVSQLAELGLPLVIALNMMDLAEAAGKRIDPEELGRLLNCPIVTTIGSQGKGLVELKHAITRQLAKGDIPNRAPLPEVLENAADSLAQELITNKSRPARIAFSEALFYISAPGDVSATDLPQSLRVSLSSAREALEKNGINRISAAIQARYAWIQQITERVIRSQATETLSFSDKLDAVLTHKIYGWIFFIGVMALMFYTVFSLAQIPMGWIESGQEYLSEFVAGLIPEGDLQSLLIDGVIAGVGAVLVFLPQIIILFIFIGLLEDTGYMARAAFIIDRIMSRVGLHGKSFVPMLSSLACAIPGVMATRTIDNKKDRLVTILVAPLMSCSARLPVYSLMIAVLLPGYSLWTKALVMLALYLLGGVAAFGMAGIFRKTLFRGERSLLLLEMPPYRVPVIKTTLLHTWERSAAFLKRAGTIIFAVSVIIWAATTYPKPESEDVSANTALAQSYAGRLGHAIEPAIRPLGYDWKIGVGILSSFAAREAFNSAMSIIYSVEESDDEDTHTEALASTMRAERRIDGRPLYTPLVASSILVFYVLAMQCLATTAVVRRETNSWRWPLFQLAYMTVLAYVAALAVYQIGSLLGFH